MRTKLFNVQSLLWLALALALAGSLKHLASVFASVDGNQVLGWLQAVAIDTGLFALAYSIRLRKAEKRSVKPLWFGVTVFTAISVYGNLSYGLSATSGNLPGWIVVTKPYILAGSLPILVLFLSELLSDDRQHAAEVAEKQERKRQRHTGNTEILPPDSGKLASVNAERIATKEAKIKELETILATNPEATNTELAKRLDVSRATIRNYKQELAKNGRIA